jgi:hypothetical protein
MSVVLCLATEVLPRAHAIELCEPQDYYNLADSSKCTIRDNNAGNKSGSRELMFEILKTYPYEEKDTFIKLLQRKIELIDAYTTQQQGQRQTEKTKANIGTLAQTKQDLSVQLGMLNVATQDNWVSVRDQARNALEEAARKLREIE